MGRNSLWRLEIEVGGNVALFGYYLAISWKQYKTGLYSHYETLLENHVFSIEPCYF